MTEDEEYELYGDIVERTDELEGVNDWSDASEHVPHCAQLREAWDCEDTEWPENKSVYLKCTEELTGEAYEGFVYWRREMTSAQILDLKAKMLVSGTLNAEAVREQLNKAMIATVAKCNMTAWGAESIMKGLTETVDCALEAIAAAGLLKELLDTHEDEEIVQEKEADE